jgi:isopentenyl diphosphate isomerase/L-lactate dehydrogenase-like FMN-dependent dehydrogenase
VKKVLRIMKDELELAMALVGCPSLASISRAIVVTPEDRLRGMLKNAKHARL